MLFDLGVDRLPFVRVLASGPLTHSNKTGDVIRPSRFVGMRNFLVITLGLLERSAVPGAIGLPRTRRDRPSRRAAEKRDEIAPSHVVFPQMPQDRTIIVNPRVLADLRLATSSNLLGCWTGKSAGLAPSSSGPTQSAPTWQNNAGRRRPPEASRPHPPPEPPSLSQVVTVTRTNSEPLSRKVKARNLFQGRTQAMDKLCCLHSGRSSAPAAPPRICVIVT